MRLPWRNATYADPASERSRNAETGVIHLQGVRCDYGNGAAPALDDFSLLVKAGEFVSVLGRSGAGKTTALRVIAGFERVSAGYVRIGGRLAGSSFVHLPPDQRRVGLVFQDYALFPHLTVAENVAFGLQSGNGTVQGRNGHHVNGRGGKAARNSRIEPILEMTGLTGYERRYVHELSGGQQQRVALARALAPEPVALLLDEPFSNLDRELRSSLRREVRQIVKRAGATTILVTHDREEALAMADRVAVMGQGRIEQIGAPEDVYCSPVSPDVARLVGPCELIPGIVRGSRVETEAGRFPLKFQGGALEDGAKVQALMRASELEIVPSDNGVDARVVFREFRGEFTEYSVMLPSGVVIRVRRRSAGALEDGERVGIQERDGSDIIVFPA